MGMSLFRYIPFFIHKKKNEKSIIDNYLSIDVFDSIFSESVCTGKGWAFLS